jgi:glycosyltransferase involved in cell wall biosynthesis
MARGNLSLLNAARGRDMIYVASPLGGMHSLLASIYLRLGRKRVIHHFHDLMDQPSSLLRFWALFATEFVHYTRTSYTGVANANPFIRRKKNFIIPCLLDFPPIDAAGAAEVVDRGIREIFYVGQVTHHKGIDLLLEAFRLLGSVNARLNVVGAPPPQYKEHFEAMVRRSSELSEIRYWGYQSNVRQYLRSAYLHVHSSPPSRFNESFGRAVVEAMSLGIPSVCFRSGSLQEVVVNGETGIVCEEETPECLAAAIGKFLNDAEFRDACGKNARQRYETVYSEAAVLPLQIEYYMTGVAPKA